MTECHLSVMSQQTTTATNRASVMHAVIHACLMLGLISRSVYIAIADSEATLYHNIAFNRCTDMTVCDFLDIIDS